MALGTGNEIRQRLSAILFADVVGYSTKMEKDQVGTHRRVMRRMDLFRSLIPDYEGEIFDIEGDAVKAVFNSAFQAVRFAVDIQREFRSDTLWNSDAEEPIFRIGINLGEVIVEGDAYYGHEVNVAARLQELATAGGICISESVRRIVQDNLPIRILPIGRKTLKNMNEPVEVYAIDLGAGTISVASAHRDSDLLPQPTRQEASLAVLPLRNLSSDPSSNHLCDGITGDLITNLSRFRDLLVIARHSAFFFREQEIDLREVGRQLGVRYVLTGGLQRFETRLSLNVQLIEVEGGGVIWSDRYKGDIRDIFDFQEDITSIISAQLSIQIVAAERRRMRTVPPSELRAYGLVLRGQDLSLQYRRDANLHARRLFEEAAAMDPDFGRSYAGMSKTYNHAWRYRWTESPEMALDKAVELATDAIKRDTLDARGHSELGYACLYKKQHDASITAYERAIGLNPNDADILAEMGDSLTSSDNPTRAIEVLKRAIRLNPLYPDWYLWNLGEAHFNLCQYEQAIEIFRKMHDQSEAHRLLAASHGLLGQLEEARRHASQVLAVHPEFSLEHWRTVPPYKNPEQLERLVEGLKIAGLR